MADPRVANGGDGQQIYRVAANMSNKQSLTIDKGCPPAWGLGEGSTPPHRKKQLVTKCYTGPRYCRWENNIRTDLRKIG